MFFIGSGNSCVLSVVDSLATDENSFDLGDLDLGPIEALPSDDVETDPIRSTDDGEEAEPLELPPMPEFGHDRREAS